MQLSQNSSFLTAPVLPKESSKPEIRTQNLRETGSECIPPEHADLFGFFREIERSYVKRKWSHYLQIKYEKSVNNRKCQEKFLIILWFYNITGEGLPHSAYWVQLEDFESCERKG